MTMKGGSIPQTTNFDHGLLVDRPENPEVGQIYAVTDKNRLDICYIKGEWVENVSTADIFLNVQRLDRKVWNTESELSNFSMDSGLKVDTDYIRHINPFEIIELNLITTETIQGNRDIFFKADGLKFYTITGGTAYEYDLSVAWDISTASLNQSVEIDTLPNALFFKPDGMKLYILFSSVIKEYDLSVAWDISTAILNQYISLDGTNLGLRLKSDGSQLYLASFNTKKIYRYDLSVAWDISTASLNQSVDVNMECQGVHFNPDGSIFYTIDYSNNLKEFEIPISDNVTATSPAVTPANLAKWEYAYFEIDPDGETITVDILDAANDSVLIENINDGESLHDISSDKNLKIRFNLSRADTANNPKVYNAILKWINVLT